MFVRIQTTLLQFGAVIKEFTLDDKGYVVVAGFGVPPFIHPHDEQRAVSAAIRINTELDELGVRNTIGLSTGVIFCSAIGSDRRRCEACCAPPPPPCPLAHLCCVRVSALCTASLPLWALP